MTRKELIPMANAHITQHTNGGDKTDWQIQENITDRTLGSLPFNLKEDQVFHIMDIIRKYELEAFNTGIKFGKTEGLKAYTERIKQLESNLERASNENDV